MLAHLNKCGNLTDADRVQAGILSAAPGTPTTIGSSNAQAKLGKFLPLKDTAHSDTEQGQFEQLFLYLHAPVLACADTDLDLPELITNQAELDEAVNWVHELEAEELLSGLPRDVSRNGVVYKAPLSALFGSTLEVLSDSNVDQV